MIWKFNKKYFDHFPVILIGLVVLAGICWYEISPLTFHQFQTNCQAIYKTSEEFNRCMKPYWSRYGFYQTVLIILVSLFIISLVGRIYLKFKPEFFQTRNSPQLK